MTKLKTRSERRAVQDEAVVAINATLEAKGNKRFKAIRRGDKLMIVPREPEQV